MLWTVHDVTGCASFFVLQSSFRSMLHLLDVCCCEHRATDAPSRSHLEPRPGYAGNVTMEVLNIDDGLPDWLAATLLRLQVLERLLCTCTALCACGMQPPPTADVTAFPVLLEGLVQARDIRGRTPLHYTAWVGSPECMQHILKVLTVQKSIVDTADECGWTPLHLACAAGNSTSIEMLLAAGAKADCADHCGWAPVHFAAQVGLPTSSVFCKIALQIQCMDLLTSVS